MTIVLIQLIIAAIGASIFWALVFMIMDVVKGE